MTKYCTHRQHYLVTEISRKSPKFHYCLLSTSNYGTTTPFQFHVLTEF